MLYEISKIHNKLYIIKVRHRHGSHKVDLKVEDFRCDPVWGHWDGGGLERVDSN